MNNKIKIFTGIAFALALASCGTKGETEKSSLTSRAEGETEQTSEVSCEESKTEQTSEVSLEESKVEQTSEIPNKGNNREETIQRAKEVISSNSGYDKDEGELLIYEKSETNLGLVTIYLEPGNLENMNITIRTEVTFNSKYNSYVNDAQMAIDLYAKTDYRYNLTFAMKGNYDYENYTFPFMYTGSAKVGEEYVKGSNKYQLLDENYKNKNNCPLTKEDCRDLFNLVLVLSFEGAKGFFSENNLDFSALYPNY